MAAGGAEHIGGEVRGNDPGLFVALCQGPAEVAGAGADVGDDVGLQADIVEAFQQACAHFALQYRDAIVIRGGAVKGMAYTAFIDVKVVCVSHAHFLKRRRVP